MRNYHGLPLSVSTFDGEGWGGRGNFGDSNSPGEEPVKDLSDAVHWAKRWAQTGGTAWSIFDGTTKALYISDEWHMEKNIKSIEINCETTPTHVVVGFPEI